LNYIVEWKLIFRIRVSFHGTKDSKLWFITRFLSVDNSETQLQQSNQLYYFTLSD
jgi:hypothetical protein